MLNALDGAERETGCRCRSASFGLLISDLPLDDAPAFLLQVYKRYVAGLDP
jgi:hypothetical protein